MAFLFPRVAFAPAVCAPARGEFAPLFSLFDEALNEVHRNARHHRRSFAPRFNPRFDVKEVKESYQLEGELPGVDQKDIQIEFTDEHTLVIKGRQEHHREAGTPPSVAAAAAPAAIEPAEKQVATPAASETASVKSHQATVEDEEPANASAVAAAAATTESSEAAVTPAPAPAAPEKTEEEKPSSRYWISERGVGEFSRSFSFPSRVDQDQVKASLSNGILSILIPKAKVPESRRINVE